MKRKHICYRSIFWVQVFLCFESIFLLHDTYEWFKFVYMGERCCEWSTDLFVVRRSPASVVHSEIYLWCWSSVHVFFIVYYRYTNKLFNRDSERTDLFVLWYVPSVVSTVHSEISLWYWCFVYFFFIACYKYTNKLNKENVLFYFIYWFARSKQIYNWMSFVITIHIELRVK